MKIVHQQFDCIKHIDSVHADMTLDNRKDSESGHKRWFWTPEMILTGFPQALEIMENLKNHQKKFHAWKNHGIWKKLNDHEKIMDFCEIIWWNHQ